MVTEASNGSGADVGSSGRRGATAAEAPAFTGLLAEPRRMKILEWLQEEGSARVRELSQAFKVSEATIRQDLERLEQELETIRREDLAYDNEEAELGLRCIAAPIRNDEGIVVAGLSISAPTERHNSSWTDQLKRATASISHALGYRQRAAQS